MPDIEKIQRVVDYFSPWVLLSVPVWFVVLVVAFVIALSFYPQLRVVLGDLLRGLGWVSKWVRKRSIENQLEGTINSFAKDFNSEVSLQLLPECSVEWVNQDNIGVVIEKGRPLVRVSFHGDYDQTFYNAANMFMRRSLIPKTKPFLRLLTSQAIDFLMLKGLLKRTRRSALSFFNDEFQSQEEELKDLFFKLEETDAKGLFKRLFLQELYFLGESLGETTPSRVIAEETEKFWDWFYNLATRESEDLTELSFCGQHLKIGIILVANPATYSRYGKEPYLRRAKTYASQHFGCVYLLARGKHSGKIVLELLRELTSNDEFEDLTHQPQVSIDVPGDEGRVLITCVCLRPVPAVIVHNAWQRLSDAKSNRILVPVTVIHVEDSSVTVDASGIIASIPKERLSSLPELDLRRCFSRHDELSVNVLECDRDKRILELSHKGTETDPAMVAGRFANCYEKPVKAVVRKILGDGPNEYGLLVDFPGTDYYGYVPRRDATMSRFKRLSEMYAPGTQVIVTIRTYSPEYKNFLCRISTLADPWSKAANYAVDRIVSAVICQVSQRSVICELEEGLESVIPFTELAWGDEIAKTQKLNSLKVGQEVAAKVLDVDAQKRRIILSIRHLSCSPVQHFFNMNNDSVVKARVLQVEQKYALLGLGSSSIIGYLPVKEYMYNYCEDLRVHVAAGQEINVRCLEYSQEWDRIRVSVKQCIENRFDEFLERFKVGDEIRGRRKHIESGRIILHLTMNESLVEGYVHMAEMSNCVYVDQSLMERLLIAKEEYSFVIKRIDDRFGIIEVSRKMFLRRKVSAVEYGKEYVGICFNDSRGHYIVYGDTFEGWLTGVSGTRVSPGEKIRVIPSRIDEEAKMVEFVSADA